MTSSSRFASALAFCTAVGITERAPAQPEPARPTPPSASPPADQAPDAPKAPAAAEPAPGAAPSGAWAGEAESPAGDRPDESVPDDAASEREATPAAETPAAGPAATRAADSDAEPGVAPIAPAAEELGAARRPSAEVDAAPPEPDDGTLSYHQDHLVLSAGVRTGLVSHSGYDPFSENDALTQFSLSAGGVFLTAGSFSLASLVLWDVGMTSAQARGLDTEIEVHRLSLGAEGRFHFFRQLFGFARVAPGALHSTAVLADAGGVNRVAREWVFATDLSGGAMFEFTGFRSGTARRKLSGWLGVEGGYGWAGESDLALAPEAADEAEPAPIPQRAAPLDLGTLAVRGPFMRITLAMTY